jgi:SAM-dependent methyltransferase
VDWEWLQKQWDAQQETYMPDREARFEAMLDVLEAVGGSAPRILDLAGGTGSITRRVLARWPDASSVIVDVDPALLKIAAGTFAGDSRVRICAADLASSLWLETLGEPPAGFDAVLTATALHWLNAERVSALYGEVGGLLRPGGLFANADHMPDDGLAGPVGKAIDDFAGRRTLRVRAESGATDWDGWWRRLETEPDLAADVAQRHARFADRAGATHTESILSSQWHADALRAAGFAQAGLVWRGLGDAVVVGLRPGAHPGGDPGHGSGRRNG